MGFFNRKRKSDSDKPHRGMVFIKGKRVKVSLSKATPNFSSLNKVFVGYQIGSRKFSSIKAANDHSNKLLKMKKGLSGKSGERGVLMKPLYYGLSI